MSLRDVRRTIKEIQGGKVRPFYLLYGDEEWLQGEVVDALRSAVIPPGQEDLSFTSFDEGPDSLRRALATAETPPFLGERRLVVVRAGEALGPGQAQGRAGSAGERGDGEKRGGIGNREAGEDGGDTGSQEDGIDGSDRGNGGGRGGREARGDGKDLRGEGDPGDREGRKRQGADGGGKKNKGRAERGDRDDESLLRYMQDPAPFSCLVILARAVDRRRRAFRLACERGAAVPCVTPTRKELISWLSERSALYGKRLEPRAAWLLAEAAGTGLRRLDLELQKLVAYTGEQRSIREEDVEGVVAGATQGSIFALLDALGERKQDHAFAILDRLLREGEPPALILFMLARQVRLIWLASALLNSGLSPDRLDAELKVHPFVARKCLAQCRNFSPRDLGRLLGVLHEADLAMKRGRLSPRLALERFLLSV